ncbi:ATP-binding protein, partial [Salinispira pacifica]
MSSTDAQNVTAAVRRFVATHQLRLGDGILVAFSGGPDSCALLFALAELRRETDFPLHAACIDHDLRPRSEMEPELEAVSKLCRRAGVPLTVLAAAPGAIRAAAHRRGIGLEAAAREQRYRLLGEARRSLRLRYV